jgi:hypothetical protein
MASLIHRGGLPYRDGWCHRGPLLHYLYAGMFSFGFPEPMAVVHFITTLVVAFQAALLFLLVRRSFSTLPAFLAALFFAFYSSYGFLPEDTLASNAEIWMNLFLLISIYFLLKAIAGNRFDFSFFCGFFMGLAGLTKQSAFLLLPWMALSLWWGLEWGLSRQKLTRPAWIKTTLLMLAGSMLPVAGTTLFFLANNSLFDFLHLFLHYNLEYLRSFQGSAAAQALGPILQSTGERILTTLLLPFSPRHTMLLYLPLGYWLVRSVLRHWQRREHPPAWLEKGGKGRLGAWAGFFLCSPFPKPGAFYLTWWAFSMLPLFLLGRAYGHYYLQPLLCVSVLAAIFWHDLFQRGNGSVRLRVGIVSMLLLFSLYPFWRFLAALPQNRMIQIEPELQVVAKYVRQNSQPEETIFYWGWDSQFYHLAGRPCAGRFFYCPFLTGNVPSPQGTDPQGKVNPHYVSLWLEDLEKWKPRLIIDGHRASDLFSAFPLDRYPSIQALVNQHYHVSAKMGLWTVFQRNHEPAK